MWVWSVPAMSCTCGVFGDSSPMLFGFFGLRNKWPRLAPAAPPLLEGTAPPPRHRPPRLVLQAPPEPRLAQGPISPPHRRLLRILPHQEGTPQLLPPRRLGREPLVPR